MNQASSETGGRARCAHCDLLLWELGPHAGTCWSCGKRPEEWQKPARPALSLVREEEEEMPRQIQHESSGTGLEMVPVEGNELVGDGSGEALPELLIPDDAPACYGNPPEDEGWDQSQCEECMVLDLCMEYVKLSEGLEEPPEPETPTWPESPAKPDYRVIDNNTGELVQLSLLGAQWEQYKVATIRLSLSGGDEYIKTMFDQIVDGELTPGALVRVVASGVVKEHAPVYKKGGHEGKTVILLEVLNKIEVIGHMTGKVEAAQNVDGEAKVLEEEEIDPEVALQEADDLRNQEEAEE